MDNSSRPTPHDAPKRLPVEQTDGESDADPLEVILGQTTDVQAELFVRCHPHAPLRGFRGTLTGPHCPYARTLPATIPLEDRGSRPTPLLQVTVPDPCCWTPALPFLYRLDIELHYADGSQRQLTRPVGLRRWGAAGRNLLLDGRRTVLRGGRVNDLDESQVLKFRQQLLTPVVPAPGKALCSLASRLGLMLVADLTTLPASGQQDRFALVARWPAVVAAILDDHPWLYTAARPRGTLCAQIVASCASAPAPWAELAICRIDARQPLDPIARWDLPTGVLRDEPTVETAERIRRSCEAVQRDLAGTLDLAAYFV